MKILHLSGTFRDDGASSSVINLHKKLIDNKVNSECFIHYKEADVEDKEIFSYNKNKKLNDIIRDKFENYFIYLLKKNKNFAFFNNNYRGNLFGILQKKKFDILHIHWFPRLFDFKKLLNIEQPILFTLRDYWLLTGGCNYPVDCDKYKTTCNTCPNLNINFKNDLSFYNFLKKREIIKKIKSNIYIICLNKEIFNEVKKLNIFIQDQVYYIPNAIDDTIFFKLKSIKKKSKKKIILFGAQNLDQEWKGTDILINLSKKIDSNKYSFMSYGKISKNLEQRIKENIDYKNLGLIQNDELYKIYNNSDCFLFPSKIETFGKVILESLFCGTPVVAFNQFAPKDIITHKINGYLVKPDDMNDLLTGIEFASNKIKFDEKSTKILRKNYGYTRITKRYEEVYLNILKKIQ